MRIKLSEAQAKALCDFLDAHADAELLAEKAGRREYVADFYDTDRPVSMDVILGKNAMFVDGAAYLDYDEELDGWYIGERIGDAQTLLDLLRGFGAPIE